ncbi:MAG: class D sortase [Clostridia bacterium]|nr:class D sortase [Clostridia bacterium]
MKKNFKFAPKRLLLFGASFILTAAIIFCGIQLIFNNFIVTNPYWKVLLSAKGTSVNTEGFMESLESIEIETKQDEEQGKEYYDLKDFPKIKWGDIWAYITIEGTDLVKAPVYCGDTEDLISKGVGKYYGSCYPGEGGNIVFSAHVMQHFYCLEDLPIGTKITLDTIYGQYVYEIYETVIFNISDKSYVLATPDEERLTMYTCYPRGYAYRTERYAVLAKKISGVDWK